MSAVVDVARTWIGTPWRLGASVRGLGCDCVGFAAGGAREAGLLPPHHPLLQAALELRSVWPEAGLRERLDATFPARAEPQPGDLLLLRTDPRIEPWHLAVLAGPTIVHARMDRGVVEDRWAPPWIRRLAGAWDWSERGEP